MFFFLNSDYNIYFFIFLIKNVLDQTLTRIRSNWNLKNITFWPWILETLFRKPYPKNFIPLDHLFKTLSPCTISSKLYPLGPSPQNFIPLDQLLKTLSPWTSSSKLHPPGPAPQNVILLDHLLKTLSPWTSSSKRYSPGPAPQNFIPLDHLLKTLSP